MSSCGIAPAVNLIKASMLHQPAKHFNGNVNTLILDQGGYATVNGSVVDSLSSLDDDLCVSLWFMKNGQDAKYEVLWQLASTVTGKLYLQLSTRRNGQRITLTYLKNANRVSQNVHFDLSSTVDDRQWHYLLVCVNYPTVTMNLDGVFVTRTTSKPLFDDNPNHTNAEMRLGSSLISDRYRFVGSMGHVYLMQGANLINDEIQCLISCGQMLQFSSRPPILARLDKWQRTLTLEGNETARFYGQALMTVEYKTYGPASSSIAIQVRMCSFRAFVRFLLILIFNFLK